jgi:hypothetical protein
VEERISFFMGHEGFFFKTICIRESSWFPGIGQKIKSFPVISNKIKSSTVDVLIIMLNFGENIEKTQKSTFFF